MIVEFREIPEGNSSSGEQDTFELFARDFLEAYGFKILQQPTRGKDEKCDMIVEETLCGITSSSKIKWLVSCKHFAHSANRRSVYPSDEPEIRERLEKHKCDGFIGFYSTIASSGLSNHLIEENICHDLFDYTRIALLMIDNVKMQKLFSVHLPLSFVKHQQSKATNFLSAQNNAIETKVESFSKEDLVSATKTGVIIIEVEKIKERYGNVEWENGEEILQELYKFSEHNTKLTSDVVLDFLTRLSNMTRSRMPSSTSFSIFSLVLSFFRPRDVETGSKADIEICKQCIHIGSNMFYDAAIYLNNFDIMENGLTVIKLIYKHGRENNIEAIQKAVREEYRTMESHLDRPERKDLDIALDFLKLYKGDLEEWDLAHPPIPEELMNRIRNRKGTIYGKE